MSSTVKFVFARPPGDSLPNQSELDGLQGPDVKDGDIVLLPGALTNPTIEIHLSSLQGPIVRLPKGIETLNEAKDAADIGLAASLMVCAQMEQQVRKLLGSSVQVVQADTGKIVSVPAFENIVIKPQFGTVGVTTMLPSGHPVYAHMHSEQTDSDDEHEEPHWYIH